MVAGRTQNGNRSQTVIEGKQLILNRGVWSSVEQCGAVSDVQTVRKVEDLAIRKISRPYVFFDTCEMSNEPRRAARKHCKHVAR